MTAMLDSASPTLMAHVRRLWLCAFLPFLLLGLDQFLYATGRGPAPKYIHVVAFVSGMALFLPSANLLSLLRLPVMMWCGAYLIVSTVWSMGSKSADVAGPEMVNVVTTIMYVSLACVVVPQLPTQGLLVRVLVWMSLVLAVCSVAYDAIDPGVLVPQDVYIGRGGNISGRFAGVYLNPNIAAQALLLIANVIVFQTNRLGASIAMILALLGIALTFSRGGGVAWLVVAASAIGAGRIPRRRGAMFGVLGVTAFLAFSGGIIDFMSRDLQGDWSDSIARVEYFAKGGASTLEDDRARIAVAALREIADAPVLGHGLGFSYFWGDSNGANTHNVYFKYALDFGLLGLAIFPFFLVALVRSAPAPLSTLDAANTIAVAALLGIFSHNLMEQASFLLSMGLLVFRRVGAHESPHGTLGDSLR